MSMILLSANDETSALADASSGNAPAVSFGVMSVAPGGSFGVIEARACSFARQASGLLQSPLKKTTVTESVVWLERVLALPGTLAGENPAA
ncbi:hypothetical protein D1O30_19015 [Methylocystis hirsuta]|uniref:Uncharacterized protein n=1 Tax=Methylocystis hirsuta TaxID=369798 RepID=A0A3M9XTN4_9HYPH|nr:hypothetical protein D1O30_19015 [Methylocystis hirsuta]